MATIQEFNYSVNLLQAVIWQYNQSPNLLSLITQKQEWYTQNQTDFWQSWFDDVFNLQTANTFGLAVWSIILNVPLYVPYNPEPSDKPIWGFNAFDPSFPTLENTYLNFFGSNFSSRGDIITLTEEEQLFLLRLRYYQLITRGEVWDINKFLNYLCDTSNIGFTGRMYALDGLNMTMRYILTTGDFPEVLLGVLIELDILPRPAAVGIDEVIVNSDNTWGFNQGAYPDWETSYVNFGNGNFNDGFFINTF
jgi:hypothetical protein